MEDKFPEAGAVAYFGYKRTDGFEVSFTLRDKTGAELMKRVDGAIAKIKETGGTPLPLKGGFGNKEKKPLDFIEGRVCPKDGGRLIKTITKTGKGLVKCENNKYDFATKQAIGCPFTEWEESKPMGNQASGDIPERDIREDY